MYKIIRRPLVTEKNTHHAETGVYAFEVDRTANKQEIKSAVEKAFHVKVEDVRTLVCRGRARRTRTSVGKAQYWKKALVRLKAGEKIQLFEGV